MDGNRFDALTRSLARSHPRRTVLKTAVGGAAGGLLSLIGAGRAGAASKVTLCHKPGTPAQHNLTVAAAAVPDHLGHGDYLNASGCCPGGTPVCLDTAGNGSCCPAPSRCLANGTCCTPTTCAAEGKNCGVISDRCDGTIDCGPCTSPQSCGGSPSGAPNVCGCTATTCAAQNATCGSVPDGCGNILPCGACDSDACLTCDDDTLGCVSRCTTSETCVAGSCKLNNGTTGCVADDDCLSGVCTHQTCRPGPGNDGASCDSNTDCTSGHCVTSGPHGICCSSGNVCSNQCCDTPDHRCHTQIGGCCLLTTCEAEGVNCGTIDNGCGVPLDCGECTAPQTCGGDGIPNVCGCPPDCSANICGGDDGCGGICQTGDCGLCQECAGDRCVAVADDRCAGGCCNGECCTDGQQCDGDFCQDMCLDINTVCAPGDNCCPGTTCDFVERNVFGEDFQRCCRAVNDSCTLGVDCCQPPRPGSGTGRIDTGCYDEICCVAAGFTCRTTTDCCGDGLCQLHPIPNCQDTTTCCQPAGGRCDVATAGDCECCSGNCVAGTCD